MSDGAWLEPDEVAFEHHPDVAEWMLERGSTQARVARAAQVEGHRWTLLECADAAGQVVFRALARGDDALCEGDEPAFGEALARLLAGSQSRA